MARKFKVLAGSHFEEGREYKKDEVVTSWRDLNRFTGKFQDLGPVPEPTPPAPVIQAAPPAPPAPLSTPTPPAKPEKQPVKSSRPVRG
jgi:hypothetical protein